MATADPAVSEQGMGEKLLERHKKPVCLIILGMAGSGKTTFVQQLTSRLHTKEKPPYVINLDPACREVPYPVNIDIRDTVNYKVRHLTKSEHLLIKKIKTLSSGSNETIFSWA